MTDRVDWAARAQRGVLASGIDPADRRGHKNHYIDLLQKMALEEILELKGDETVLDFGCGSGRISYWIAPKVKKVVGMEVTPEMIELAEKNRIGQNVEFILYDGVNFPALASSFDLILSVGVLQTMKGEGLKRALSELVKDLKPAGKLILIEQVSDHPEVGRPRLREYLQAFEESKLICSRYYPLRNGRWWCLYLIRYGFVPGKWFRQIASWELKRNRGRIESISYYKDFLFLSTKA